eukprot:11969192-Alexandrium_andersonii.AAC.1
MACMSCCKVRPTFRPTQNSRPTGIPGSKTISRAPRNFEAEKGIAPSVDGQQERGRGGCADNERNHTSGQPSHDVERRTWVARS